MYTANPCHLHFLRAGLCWDVQFCTTTTMNFDLESYETIYFSSAARPPFD